MVGVTVWCNTIQEAALVQSCQMSTEAREHQARRVEFSQPSVNPGVPGVGLGPILRSGENDKAPTIYRPPH
jgi:hypothetical protein